MARAAIAETHAAGRLPILAGGTGLYLRTLVDGIAPVPPVDPDVRNEVRAASLEENRARLEKADPEGAARLGSGDKARTARALEVVLSTGRSLADWQSERSGGIAQDVNLLPLILLPPRPWLYARCDARFGAMIVNGAIEEVQALLARRLDPALPVMRAIGVREIAAFLAGETEHDEIIKRGSQATRNYAKRQYTWFRRQPPPKWHRVESDNYDIGNLFETLFLYLHLT